MLVRGLAVVRDAGAWPGPWCVILVRGLALVHDAGAWPGPWCVILVRGLVPTWSWPSHGLVVA